MPYKYSENDSSINTHLVSYKTFNRAVGYDFITENWTHDNNESAADIIQGIPIGKCYFKRDITNSYAANLESPEIFGTSFTIDILVYIPSGYGGAIAYIRTDYWTGATVYIGVTSNNLYIDANYVPGWHAQPESIYEETFSKIITFNSLSHIEITVDDNTKTLGIFYNGRLLRLKDLSGFSHFIVNRCVCEIFDFFKTAYDDYYKLPKYVKEVKIYDTILHTSSFTPPTQYTPTTYTEEFYKQYLLCYLPLDDKNHPFFDMCGNKWVYSDDFVVDMKKSLENSITNDCNVVKGFLHTRYSINPIAKTQVPVKDPYNYTIDFYLLITSFDNVSSDVLLFARFEYSDNDYRYENGIVIKIESGVLVFYYYDYGRENRTNISLDFNKLTHIELSISNRSVYVYIDGECKFSMINTGTMTGRSQYNIILEEYSDHVYISQFRVFNIAVHSGTNNFERPNLYDYDVNYDNIKSINLITYHNGTKKSYPYYLWTSLYDFPLDSTIIHHNGYNWYNRNAHVTSNDTKIMYAHDDRKKYLSLTYAQAIWDTDNASVIENVTDSDEEYLQTNPLKYTVKSQPTNNLDFTGSKTFISMAGSSDDYVTLHSGSNILLTGEGNDTVQIKGSGGSEKHTIHTGEGNDSVRIDSGYGPDYMLIYTGKGNDTISLAEHHHTIVPGLGDDLVQTRAEHNHENIIVYREGDGNDTIITQNPIEGNRDTLSIVGSAYSSVQSGDNIIITVGNGHITLQGGVSKPINLKFTST